MDYSWDQRVGGLVSDRPTTTASAEPRWSKTLALASDSTAKPLSEGPARR
ncbi:hypothetical protein IQ265_14925 [Nodosilinea sp. LEGE 06152]|nr:hypothetical protein [Nodosilinea sp. LEGE 06152]MBE9158110.1 hypothetical protein [Nodosilinea sp. LEGE 06152]